jgi:hypothetical protein
MSETNLYITLNEQDAKLLAAAIPEGLARRDSLGILKADTLAHVALGAVCLAILGGAYRPRPLSAHLRREDPATSPALPPGVIKVQLA